MKRKKWLIIITFVLVFINVIFFVIQHVGKHEYVKSKIVSYIEKKYQIKIDFSGYEINEKKFTLFNLKVNKDAYKINILRMDIEYNIFNFIFSQLLYKTKINSIKIYNPEISINITDTSFNKSSPSKFNFQDLKFFFNEFYVLNAKINFFYKKDKLLFKETFSNFNFSLNKKNEINLQTKTFSSSEINLKSIIKNNSINNLEINIKDYKPQKIIYEEKSIFLIFNLEFFKDKEIYYNAVFKDINFFIRENKFFSPELKIKGKDFQSIIESKEITCNDIYKFSFYTILQDVHKKKIEIKEMSLYDKKFKGSILLKDKEIKLNLSSKNLFFQKKIIF